MKMQCHWNEAMRFTATARDLKVSMDAKRPIGGDTAMTPKELVVAGLCGCTAMDVAALMKKHQQKMTSFEVFAEVATSREGTHPSVFEKAELLFVVEGEVDASRLVEAVTLSQTRYCGVSAMLAKAMPITYSIELNGERIHSGSAQFEPHPAK